MGLWLKKMFSNSVCVFCCFASMPRVHKTLSRPPVAAAHRHWPTRFAWRRQKLLVNTHERNAGSKNILWNPSGIIHWAYACCEKKQHFNGTNTKAASYQIIVADAADAVSVNFSGRCKFFFRFNAKNWQFTVYFAVITQKIVNLLCILS